MLTKRLRIFAGPNGSGKTTIINKLKEEIPFGVYVNADDIELNLKISKTLIFNNYQLQISESQIHKFFKSSTFSPIKRNENDLWTKFVVKDNVLHINTHIDSYLSADISEFIRQELLNNGISFTFETVMSYKNKIEILQKAKDLGYRVYFYYVATEDPAINISRVKIRVQQNGHDVNSEIIEKRYYKSLENLKIALKKSDIAYFWDTSRDISILIAEITNGIDVNIISENIPNWFYKYLIKKGFSLIYILFIIFAK